MKMILFFLLATALALSGQVDNSFIEEIPRDKTFQYHLTVQDFAVKISGVDEDNAEFRIHNLSTGFYFKFGLAELSVSLPLRTFRDMTYGARMSFATGFGINVYKDRFHFNYNFKYVQGFDSFSQVRSDGLGILSNYSHFVFNRLNTHYLFNAEKFSLRAALRFDNRQKKSAGSWIIGAPISYHYTSIKSNELQSLGRFSIGAMGGYAYSYVVGQWSTSVVAKAGFDIRYSKFQQMSALAVRPSVNLIISSVYNVGHSFIGASYYYYPEYDYGGDVHVEITNWKLRLYVGRRFF